MFAQSQTITIEEAISLAESSHPSLRTVNAEATAVAAELQESNALLWNNPQLNAEARQRRLGQINEPEVIRRDAAVGISQIFETGGQATARRNGARASLSASEATFEVTRREVRSEAAQRFFQVLTLQQLVKMEEGALDLLQQASTTVQKRVTAGEDSRMDGNLATVEMERSANQLAQFQEQLEQARSALATTLQLPPSSLPHAAGELAITAPAYTLDDLLTTAARHPRLRVANAIEQVALDRLALERASTAPDVTVGLSYSPERSIDTQDRITTLSVSVPLPLFRRNEGGIGRAVSDVERSRVDRESAERTIEATVRLLWQQQTSLRRRVDRLQLYVLPKLDENQRMSFKALEAGELSFGQYLLVRRQTMDGQRDLLDATAELLQTHIELEAAGGWPENLPPIGVSTNTNTK